jgi:hypothetical protein
MQRVEEDVLREVHLRQRPQRTRLEQRQASPRVTPSSEYSRVSS